MTAEHPGRHRRTARAVAALRGLAVGDALGSQFFLPDNYALLKGRGLPPGTWQWTDDTEMACSIVTVLDTYGEIRQDELAASFAAHHDARRGYGRAVDSLLGQIRQNGADWRELSAALFDGAGSWGNGAAMRVAPLGAWCAGDPARAAEQAELSAYVSHQHREAVAGARAVAAAAAVVAGHAGQEPLNGADLLKQVLDAVPRSAVQAGVRRARDMLDYADVGTVAAVLGCGRRTSAHDTVPFALWAAARHSGDFTAAFWTTAQAGGDIDTTCAIACGVVASGGTGSAAPPEEWEQRTEALPDWLPEPGAG